MLLVIRTTFLYQMGYSWKIIDNVFGHVLTAVLCVSGGSIAYGDEIANEDVKVDVSSTLAPALEAKPTIYAR